MLEFTCLKNQHFDNPSIIIILYITNAINLSLYMDLNLNTQLNPLIIPGDAPAQILWKKY